MSSSTAEEYRIRGSIYIDTNQNGLRDVGEQGYPDSGWIGLFCGAVGLVAPVLADGLFDFPQKEHRVIGTLAAPIQEGYRSTAASDDEGFVSKAIFPDPDPKDLEIDLGVVPRDEREVSPSADGNECNISGTVFIDGNRNGIRDPGEVGFPGYTGEGTILALELVPGREYKRVGELKSLLANTAGAFSTTDQMGPKIILEPGRYHLSCCPVYDPNSGWELTTPGDRFFMLRSAKIVDFGIAKREQR